jgi:hypothetical protein
MQLVPTNSFSSFFEKPSDDSYNFKKYDWQIENFEDQRFPDDQYSTDLENQSYQENPDNFISYNNPYSNFSDNILECQ